MTNIKLIHEIARQCREDPAYIIGIHHALRESGLGTLCGWTPPPVAVEGPPPPFPPTDTITAIQTSVFDNWPAGKPVKSVPSRYGMAVEVWTVEANKITISKGKKPNFQHKAQMALMDSVNLKRQVADIRRKKRKTPVDAGYLDTLDALVDVIQGTGWRVGLINTNVADGTSGYNRGRYYHAHQFVMILMDESDVKEAKMILCEDFDSALILAPFSDRDAAGNPLGRNVIAQSRDDKCGIAMTSWATNEV